MLGEITFFAREVSVTEMAEIMFSGFSLRVRAILLLSLLANLLLSVLALPVQILTQPRYSGYCNRKAAVCTRRHRAG
jgi:hypothetical protein